MFSGVFFFSLTPLMYIQFAWVPSEDDGSTGAQSRVLPIKSVDLSSVRVQLLVQERIDKRISGKDEGAGAQGLSGAAEAVVIQ